MLRFKIFAVPIEVSFWALLLVSCAVVSSVKGQEIVLVCLLCTLIHESGHLLMICKVKGKPQSIIVNPFEIRINSELSDVTLKEEILIVSFGVIFNLMFSLVAGLLYLIFPFEMFLQISISSLCIGILNLMPVESLDGGQLFAIILNRLFSQNVADKIIDVVGVVFILPIAITGVAVLFISKYNFSVLFIALFLFSIYISKELR